MATVMGYHHCTDKRYIKQEVVEQQALPYVEKAPITNSRLVEWIKEALKESHKQKIGFETASLEQLNGRYEAVQRRIDLV